jgi:hypothetical protein
MEDERPQQITPEEAMTYFLFLASHFQRRALLIVLLATTRIVSKTGTKHISLL